MSRQRPWRAIASANAPWERSPENESHDTKRDRENPKQKNKQKSRKSVTNKKNDPDRDRKTRRTSEIYDEDDSKITKYMSTIQGTGHVIQSPSRQM